MVNLKYILGLIFISGVFLSEINAQSINKLNANGEKTGLWQKKYKNGKIRYTGQFKNGKEVGVFKFYDSSPSTSPTITKEFSSSTDIAKVKFLDEKGRVKAEGNMKGKKREGKWVYYFSNRKTLSIENYSDGKLNGLTTNFYANGKKTNETNYLNGIRHGNSKTYTELGILIENVTYDKGILNGPAEFFDLKGNLSQKGSFVNGIRKGEWDYYYDGEVSKKPKKQKFKRKG